MCVGAWFSRAARCLPWLHTGTGCVLESVRACDTCARACRPSLPVPTPPGAAAAPMLLSGQRRAACSGFGRRAAGLPRPAAPVARPQQLPGRPSSRCAASTSLTTEGIKFHNPKWHSVHTEEQFFATLEVSAWRRACGCVCGWLQGCCVHGCWQRGGACVRACVRAGERALERAGRAPCWRTLPPALAAWARAGLGSCAAATLPALAWPGLRRVAAKQAHSNAF